MFKTTLAAALLASASATGTASSKNQEVAKAAGASVRRAKSEMKNLHTQQHVKALSAVKLAGGSGGVSLKASGVSKSARVAKTPLRALRGKGGKGKGKGKDDDDEEEEGEETMSDTFLSFSAGACAGGSFGGVTVTEDLYTFHGQFRSGACENMIDSDGMAYSMAITVTAEPFSVTEKYYAMHDCKEEYLASTMDATADFTFGGLITETGVCTDLGGFGVKLMVSDASITMPGGFLGVSENTHVNNCVAGDLSSYDFVEMEAAVVTLPGVGSISLCHSVNDSDDDDFFDDAAVTGSFSYDVSGCGGSPSSIVMNSFSDDECSVSTDSAVAEASFCYFDYEDFADEISSDGTASFLYSSMFCSAV